MGFAPTGVLPVVADLSYLDREPNRLVAGHFDDDWTNILFVGRVIPNKRIEDVIRAFHTYKREFNPRSRLLIVGSYGGFDRYLAMLQQLVAALGTPDVHFTGQCSDGELAAYYDVADLYLCTSGHEGFCVPLIEAFSKQIPVLAYASTAVPSTMDGAGVLFSNTDPLHVASLMDAVLSDQRLYDAIIAGQDAALARLQGRDFDGLLLRFIEQVLAAPRRPPHQVAWDFWNQVQAIEDLDELRQYRPALYGALPEAPGLEPRRPRAEG
jgi:L-malate glycosyltransferase